MKHLEFNVITCGKVRGVETWRKLERALLISFKERYGAIPKANKVGPRGRGDMEYFRIEKLNSIIDELG
jgi:hypothetical protein